MNELMEITSKLFEEQEKCPDCNGAGIDNVENPCKACDGTGHKLDEAKLNESGSYQDTVDYWKQYLSSAIVSKGVFRDLYDAAGKDIQVLNWAIESQAESIARTYHDSGHGIGTSDINHFIQGIGSSLGIKDLFGWYADREEQVEEDHYGQDMIMDRIVELSSQWVETTAKEYDRHQFEVARDLANKIKNELISRYT